ncbi:hypothetical protein C8R44DRAFT_745853 [Mycena epipterygia]|nr:hypothetical protein C8R44DRAFT_745853 [Mycena epipterygia]
MTVIYWKNRWLHSLPLPFDPKFSSVPGLWIPERSGGSPVPVSAAIVASKIFRMVSTGLEIISKLKRLTLSTIRDPGPGGGACGSGVPKTTSLSSGTARFLHAAPLEPWFLCRKFRKSFGLNFLHIWISIRTTYERHCFWCKRYLNSRHLLATCAAAGKYIRSTDASVRNSLTDKIQTFTTPANLDLHPEGELCAAGISATSGDGGWGGRERAGALASQIVQ